jgi:glycosyltransferase involved in cell wall biosynthesis
MTASAETRASGAGDAAGSEEHAADPDAGEPCGKRWRQAAGSAQEAAMPRGRVVVTCSAPLGKGGLGRHLSEILAALARAGQPAIGICGSTRADDPGSVAGLPAPADPSPGPAGTVRAFCTRAICGLPGLSPGLRTRAFVVEFDAYAARRLPAGEHLIAFNSQALTQFQAARKAGYQSLALVSANSHLGRVARRHAQARARYPLEGSWTARLVKRNLAEYERADRIYVASEYVRESFLAEGFAEERLVRFPLTPDPRYTPAADGQAQAPDSASASDSFDVVYVGSLAVHKGVPLLIDAFRRLSHRDMRLLLVGGWGTRGMRRFVQRACATDPRILAGPGDPLPRLREARLCAHPAYEDGFGYAPAEALACGVPVLVSEDTGMKELIREPRTGMILPTGDLDALTEALDAAYRGEIFGG